MCKPTFGVGSLRCIDEMRILFRIIGGSHTIKSCSKLTPSDRVAFPGYLD